ncbi:MAG: hypothetical protein KDA90_17495 [Planctomycetaceae bacterium]|nr:hypothetical protein [Planctomycetaceae bacterium]
MKQKFQGWDVVASHLRQEAEKQQDLANEKGESATRLNEGQRASLHGIASRIVQNGVVIADEVGMGKTRIAVELARCVIESGGRVAILLPPGLGYQWRSELQDGGLHDVQPILRSLYTYLKAWAPDDSSKRQPWFEEDVVMFSHAFTNWRLGQRTDSWRWALLPELYACWRKSKGSRLPRGYNNNAELGCKWLRGAANSICSAVPRNQKHPVKKLLDQLLIDIQWPRPLDAEEYSKSGALRDWLERAVGFGLGVFDLIIIDEAHKSRGTQSGLSRLLENVIVSSGTARRVALTATPVELNVSQWYDTLSRLRLNDAALVPVREAITQYADAVTRVRQTWRSSEEARTAYGVAALHFQRTLSPYLLRRDKREDPEVQRFHNYSKLPINEYRRETEISVDTNALSMAWRRAICAAESLSLVTRQSTDPVAKRLRLTLGNGHGIAAILDQINRDNDDHQQEVHDETNREYNSQDEKDDQADGKRQDRAKWWLKAIKQAFTNSEDSLFDHPAIQKAVEVIESETRKGEKVLVFGRFTRPLRALVDLLNAREMLRRLENNQPWPQAKVHGDFSGNTDNSEWPAVRAGHCQLECHLPLESLDETLRTAYERERHRREHFRERLISRIEQGLEDISDSCMVAKAIFDAFKRSVETTSHGEQSSLALVSRALMELMGNIDADISPSDYAKAFCELVVAVSDGDNDDDDSEVDEAKATELWQTIEKRLGEELNRTQGGFARLMFGGTEQASRRMVQLAFNRPKSFPRVLVAQSLVGREGLNLHKACRIVVLLHPEWNPGVVEQQIGRLDRVGSHWCNELRKAIESNATVDQLPRIEVRPVVFQGTYDEKNWQVLRMRWDDLRSQLHGIVIPPSVVNVDSEGQQLIDDISRKAPDFSPMK